MSNIGSYDVTVSELSVPAVEDCNRYTWSFKPAFKASVVFKPPMAMKIFPEPEAPILPEAAIKLMAASGPVVLILAVDDVRVPAVLKIEPLATVMATEPAVTVFVVSALEPR